MAAITTERKKEIFADFGGTDTNTGSMDAQVALLTERINHIAGHLKDNKKDHNSKNGLLKMVGRRKRYLSYMAKTDIERYRALIAKLGLRK